MEIRRPSIYGFLNYREFIRAMIAYLKSKGPFTSRDFSKKAGFGSSGYLSMVLNEERNLSDDATTKVASALELKAREAEFFTALVRFNQASTSEEKASTYEALVQFRSFGAKKPMAVDQYHFFSNWFMPVLFEALSRPLPFSVLLKLGNSLEISETELQKSLQSMEDLGLIKLERGKYKRISKKIETIPSLGNLYIYNYHKEMLRRALRALDDTDSKERQYDCLTIGVSGPALDEIRSKIFEFIRGINETYSEESKPDKIIQINLAMFPVADFKILETK